MKHNGKKFRKLMIKYERTRVGNKKPVASIRQGRGKRHNHLSKRDALQARRSR
jgi:hypothetical protein